MKRRVRHGILQAVALASLLGSGLIASSAGAALGAPSAARAVHASGTATSISVRWLRPASSGATPIREYVVISRPSSKTCATKKTTCIVRGLKAGASYTFTVVAKNSNGASVSAKSNRVAVAKASSYFHSQVLIFGSKTTEAENQLGNAKTTAQEQKGLKTLSGSFKSFIAALSLEHWPSNTQAAMSSFITDTRKLETDTITSIEASTTNAAEDYDMLQSVTTKEVIVESSVLTDLGFPSPIIAPITATPTPVALNTTQTVHDVFGDPLSVTATQLVDPATAATGSGLPDSGYRFVAIELTLSDQSTTSAINGDANFSTMVTGSDGQPYSADYGTVSECSNFNYGDFQLLPSDSSTGCVVFELPTAVTVQSVEFTLAPKYLDTAEWNS